MRGTKDGTAILNEVKDLRLNGVRDAKGTRRCDSSTFRYRRERKRAGCPRHAEQGTEIMTTLKVLDPLNKPFSFPLKIT